MSDATPSENSRPVVTRFAPSPTGALHVGGARTALFAWAFARQYHGQFILRLEDTDQSRSSPEATRGILRDLHWLGLDWDQGPDASSDDPYTPENQRGDSGPYFQSQRLDHYNKYVDLLLSGGRAYRDKNDDGSEAVRLKMDRDVVFRDAVYGTIEVKAADLEDFVIRKGDGFPTFHLAVVVDDALMGVTHVIRGQEHLTNTSKHAALYDALGFERPVWAHTPSIMNPDNSKMSKRDKAKVARKAGTDQGWPALPLSGDDAARYEAFKDKKADDNDIAVAIAGALGVSLPEIDVADFAASGYLPDVLCNYIALLGWSPGNDVERFDRDFLVEHFSLDRIGRKNAKFDRDKLFRFNGDTLAAMPEQDFCDALYTHFVRYHEPFLAKMDADQFRLFAGAYHARSRTLSEPAQLGAFFIAADDAIEYDDKAMKKVMHKNDGEGFAALRDFAPKLESQDDWTAEAIESLVKSYAEETGLGMGKIAQPIRVAVTGSTVSPSIGDTLVILGKPSTLARIERLLAQA